MLFKFVKDAGEKLRDGVSNIAEGIKDRIQGHKTEVKNLEVEEAGDGRVVVKGTARNRAEAEKAIVAAGNTPGIGEVEAQIDIEDEPNQTVFYTVQKGDTLSKISKDHYGDPMKYPTIFEANKPMLSDPDKIYPGQTLRIPSLD
ncbi:peptidoglycan-binding protein LysM [Hyphococcus flavus]|uniref:Potassium binding protein Kbp n=1 Tax=Hyphococcus flavus TaxID=1866326 RepID=A0AAE9ZB35_9PROT|nr:peptidoglycan-binding protein LysM [Hyphococcus flavus]WDI30721.1 peptidoglycan-binding protein LysM [Hyphococcus flavus]